MGGGFNKLLLLRNGNLLSGDDKGKVKIWNTNTYSLIKILSWRNSKVWTLAELSNGYLASGDNGGVVYILDPTSNLYPMVRIIRAHNTAVRSLAVLRNGNLASGSFKEIKIWNVNDGSLVRTIAAHTDQVKSLLVLRDGFLASGSGYYDGTIKIWNTDNGVLIKTLDNFHSVDSLVLLPNGLFASTFYLDVRIWNIDTSSLVKVLTGHSNWVWSLTALENGNLVSADADGVVKIWN
jgi:WD40 repeat protein